MKPYSKAIYLKVVQENGLEKDPQKKLTEVLKFKGKITNEEI